MTRKTKKRLIIWGIVLLIPAVLIATIRIMSIINPPEGVDMSYAANSVAEHDGYTEIGGSKLRKNDYGVWELYLEGEEFKRGVDCGKLTKDLLYYQEKVFVDQIRVLVPSDTYLGMLRYLVGFFNRNLSKDIPEEYLKEIYGISLSCTDEYDFIGTPYQRQLNYHAAHDIGHALHDLMLVGCTSFAVWNEQSADSSLLVGRNFDFYMGDEFAKNKLVSFYNPSKGYKFAMVGWAGMVGVLSGMNEEGLTVTINAAKSSIPLGSATPISILTRQILQYASTIDEAYSIAQSYSTFVSESILIASANDGKAAIIEKSPQKTDIFYSDGSRVVCSNHFQSKTFANDERNLENIAKSDSKYRFDRMQELLNDSIRIAPSTAVAILRNREGLQGKKVGYGNEKAINQMIAHHAVVFDPKKRIMYVSTDPWQSGVFIAYNLSKVFANPDFSQEIRETDVAIAADTFLETKEYADFLLFKEYLKSVKQASSDKRTLAESRLDSLATLNPDYYHAYEAVGDYYMALNNGKAAVSYWEKALAKELPGENTKEAIEKKIDKANAKK